MAAALGMLTALIMSHFSQSRDRPPRHILSPLVPRVALTISTAKLGAACRVLGNKKRADLSPVSGSSTLVRHGRL